MLKIKFHLFIWLAVLLTASSSGCGRQSAEKHGEKASHYVTGYVPWGRDEFELFGLTKDELNPKFSGALQFATHYHEAEILGTRGLFRLTFDKGKVATVQRVFIDGAGCNIKGPLLTSQEAALKFSIDGLSKIKNPGEQEQAKLATARTLLADLSK